MAYQIQDLADREPPAPNRQLRSSRGWTLRAYANGEVSVCAPEAIPGMMYLSNRGTLPQRLLYTLATSLLAGDTFAATGEQFASSDIPPHSDHGLAARLLNAADLTTLPPWTRELMRQAAAEIGSLSGAPAPDQR